jgi:Na+-transporting methylmalonyl-CoA/oxaloacetate decarboxylase gamma subunit
MEFIGKALDLAFYVAMGFMFLVILGIVMMWIIAFRGFNEAKEDKKKPVKTPPLTHKWEKVSRRCGIKIDHHIFYN